MIYQKILLFWGLFIISSCALTGEISKTEPLINTEKSKITDKISSTSPAKNQTFTSLSEEEGGVVNIKNYGAKGDGITDDTEAFKKAIERDEIANQGKIIYIPKGTYLVSDTIEWPKGFHAGLYYKRTTLMGQSQKETIIKLKDNLPSFSNGKSKPILDTKFNRANAFRNTIENLTINTGKGNKNAVGVKFNSNNGGGLFNVSIISGDGQGADGLDLTAVELGPLLIKNVYVQGFDRGILVGGGKTNSVHMENITLKEQNQLGIEQFMQVLTIRNLKSFNKVPAIKVRDHSATLALIEAELEGTNSETPMTAIETKYRDYIGATPGEKKTINVFLSDIKQKGYQNTAQVYNCDTGDIETLQGNIDEWHCGQALRGFSRQTKTLNLPVQETPSLKYDVNNVAIVKGNSGTDIQAAIDTPGVKTVFLPNGTYHIDRPILIRGSVKQIIGMRAFFSDESIDPMFRLQDGDEPIVFLERFEKASVEHNSKRTLVIAHSELRSYSNTKAGTGDVFFEDIVSGLIKIHNQNAWARSLNVEATPPDSEAKILNDSGRLWILGLKTENPGTIIETKNNSSTEVLGGFIYINQSIPDTNPPQAQYINDESKMSILTRSFLPTATVYPVFVREIKDGMINDLVNPDRRDGGRLFPYLGY
ncbi:hypothetical protein STA3757_43140 [Stanieria sp. NIES-3757]|nr:hypothetical protein STA3757_43140 [Stanieria sp. NIES-3757]